MAIDLTQFNEVPTVVPKPSQIVVYGRNGIGKSSLGANTKYGPGAVNPFYLNVNNRIGHLAVAGNKMVVADYQDYQNIVTMLINQPHNFKTLFVDTADDMERIIEADIVRIHGASSIDDKVKLPYGSGYVEALLRWEKFLKAMTMIRDKRGMTIVILAQQDVKKHSNPDGENYEIVCPKLHGSTMKGDATLPLLMAWADLVMYMKEEVYTKTESGGFTDKKNPKLKAIEGGGIFLHTKNHPAYRAKDTYELPDKIDCEYDAWGQVMNGINSYWQGQLSPVVPVAGTEVVKLAGAAVVSVEADPAKPVITGVVPITAGVAVDSGSQAVNPFATVVAPAVITEPVQKANTAPIGQIFNLS